MIEFYPEIRLAHIWAVVASGSLFALRGVGLFAGMCWPLATQMRRLVWAVDTVLLAAALMLMTLVQQYPFVHAWLTVKVLLLLAYILLGLIAFWRGPTRVVRVGAWLAALSVLGYIVSVARTHDPHGIFAVLSG